MNKLQAHTRVVNNTSTLFGAQRKPFKELSDHFSYFVELFIKHVIMRLTKLKTGGYCHGKYFKKIKKV